MMDTGGPLERIQTRQRLDEINEHILNGVGEVLEAPGKLSLVWTDPVYDVRRYLAVKAAGDDGILINGRRYPATETALKNGLVTCLGDLGLRPGRGDS